MSSSPWASQENSEAWLQAYSCDNAIGDNILHLAIRKGELDLINRLLEAGFPVDMPNDEGQTPLHIATCLGTVEAARLLVAHGADVLNRPPASRANATANDSGRKLGTKPTSRKDEEDRASPASGRKSLLNEPQRPTPVDVGFDRSDEDLLSLFAKHSIPIKMDSDREYGMLRFMARAFAENRTRVLEAFRERGWELNRSHSVGRPFLHYVAEEARDIEPLNRLLDAGAVATLTDPGGATALHVAAQLGRCSDGSVVERLIAAGIQINAKDRIYGGTPLLTAVQGGKLENVRVLLEAGADTKHALRKGAMRRTILHLAAQDGIPEIIQLLLDWGADPNVLDEMGGSPAQWAVRNDHGEAVRVLLEGGLDPNIDKGHSLRMALSLGRLNIAELFTKHGAKVDGRLVIAISDRVNYKGNRQPFFDFFAENLDPSSIENDATESDNTDTKLKWGGLSLPTMMRDGKYDLCAVLLEHGHGKGLAELEDSARGLLLCICANRGFGKGISRLLESGKLTNAVRRFGVRPFRWTALHLASLHGNLTLAELLLSHGWSLSQEDDLGRSILDLAAVAGRPELVQRLIAAHCSAEHRDREGQTALHFALSGPGGEDTDLLACLVDSGCSIAKTNKAGETALHLAARFNRSRAAVWLLDRGAAVSPADRYLNTPLHVAACFNAVPVVKILLAHGADINQAAVDGRTPLHCASQSGADSAVHELLAAGADADKPDAQRRTALATALHAGECATGTIDALLGRTAVDWHASRAAHPVVAAALTRRSTSCGAVLGRVVGALRSTEGEAKARRVGRRLMPELVPELLVRAGEEDGGSPADVIPPLLDFLPENAATRHVMLFHMLVAIIRHGGDEEGQLARRLLLLDESNVTQALPGKWGLQHLCCKYGRLKTLRVLLGLGLSPRSRLEIDGVEQQPIDIAKKYSPQMVGKLENLIECATVIGQAAYQDPKILLLIRNVVSKEHLERKRIDLSATLESEMDAAES